MKKVVFVLLYLAFNFTLNAQINEVDLSKLTLSSERFEKIATICIDSILKSDFESDIYYEFEINQEFIDPHIFKDIIQENSFLVKSYLNFNLQKIDFGSIIDTHLRTKEAKLYFEWPVIDIVNDDLFFGINIYTGPFLIKYFFRIKHDEHNFYIADLVRTMSMPHIPLEVMKSMMDEPNKQMDSLRYKSLMDSISRGQKEIPRKKNKSM